MSWASISTRPLITGRIIRSSVVISMTSAPSTWRTSSGHRDKREGGEAYRFDEEAITIGTDGVDHVDIEPPAPTPRIGAVRPAASYLDDPYVGKTPAPATGMLIGIH